MAELTLLRRQAELARAAEQVRILESTLACPSFQEHLADRSLPPLVAEGIQVLQVNLGKVCNQTCRHCHVDAGPDRREAMSRETAAACIRVLAESEIPTLDITGGAPEMNPQFRYLVTEARRLERARDRPLQPDGT
jgi:sulfatase maturation enzyme AslB (radical SAM superfamily)